MMFLMGPPSQRLRNHLGERNIIFFIDFLVKTEFSCGTPSKPHYAIENSVAWS